jgi:hypothetical protein
VDFIESKTKEIVDLIKRAQAESFLNKEEANLLEDFRAMSPARRKGVLHVADLYRWSTDEILKKLKAGVELCKNEREEYQKNEEWFNHRSGLVPRNNADNLIEFKNRRKTE